MEDRRPRPPLAAIALECAKSGRRSPAARDGAASLRRRKLLPKSKSTKESVILGKTLADRPFGVLVPIGETVAGNGVVQRTMFDADDFRILVIPRWPVNSSFAFETDPERPIGAEHGVFHARDIVSGCRVYQHGMTATIGSFLRQQAVDCRPREIYTRVQIKYVYEASEGRKERSADSRNGSYRRFDR